MLVNILFLYEVSNKYSYEYFEKLTNSWNDYLSKDDLVSKYDARCVVRRSTLRQFRKNYKKPINESIAILFIDESSWQQDMFFELGLFAGLDVPKIIAASSGAEKKLKKKSDDIIICDSPDILLENGLFISRLHTLIAETRRQLSYISSYFAKVWFPLDTKNITVIVGPEFEPPIDGNLTSHNYDFLDTVGDKDAILEVFGLLSRRYPEAIIEIVCSSNSRINLKQNIVIIGGPGGPDYVRPDGTTIDATGNIVCRRISERIKSRISYTSDCEAMILDNKKYEARYD